MELPPRLGPYRPLEHLGSGGMGEVYLARAPDGALLAVKTIRADLLDRPSLRVRLRREAEALAQVRGDHLAELIAYDLEAEPPYLATRYIQGRSLRDVVSADGPLPAAALWQLADGLARALASIHGAGYLHRDLKPANVMLVDGSPVVIDFGISHALDETRLSRHGRASGTPAYMAPELVAEGRADPAGDIYSWAATVTYAATGRDAHWSALGPAGLARILFSTPTLTPALRDLLDSAFAPTPADRPTAEELITHLAPLAPVTGPDLHLDHPHEPGATTVTLTLPGARRVTLDLPPDAVPGITLTFPAQGRPGRHGGPPGTLHLHLISPEKSRPAETENAPVPSGRRRARHAFLWVPVLLLVGVGILVAFSVLSADGDGREEAPVPMISDRSLVFSSSIPASCQLLRSVNVEWIASKNEPVALQKNPGRSPFGEVDLCSMSGVIEDFPSELSVEVTLIDERAGEVALARSEQAFRERKRLVGRNPYSRDGYRSFVLGDEAFSHVRVVNGETLVAAEVLIGNVIVGIEVRQGLAAAEDPRRPEAVRERLEEMAEETVSVLLGQTVSADPGP